MARVENRIGIFSTNPPEQEQDTAQGTTAYIPPTMLQRAERRLAEERQLVKQLQRFVVLVKRNKDAEELVQLNYELYGI